MDNVIENYELYLPILIPLLILQFALALYALIDVLRSDHFKIGNKLIWIPIVFFVSLIGPIIYFAFGKGEKK